MYYNDHFPAHFHVRYASDRGVFLIQDLAMLEGDLSPRVRALVTEWAAMHEHELREAWGLARERLPLPKIEPLR